MVAGTAWQEPEERGRPVGLGAQKVQGSGFEVQGYIFHVQGSIWGPQPF